MKNNNTFFMKNNNIFFLLLFLSTLFFSCPKPDITPAYLYLTAEDFNQCLDVSDFNTTHDKKYESHELEAISQQTFNGVLVSLNGDNLGYSPLPCRIPLLPNYNGRNNISIVPCVRIPNSTYTLLSYDFVKSDPEEFFLEIEREKEYKVADLLKESGVDKLKYKYVTSVDFPVLETFMQSTDFKPRLDSLYSSTIEIFYDNDLKKNTGRLILKDSAEFFDIVTPYIPLIGKGERLFLEISYKSVNGRMNTALGFEKTLSGISGKDIYVFPSSQGVWKKAYADITEMVREASYNMSQVSTRLRITGFKEQESFDAYFYFENIKLITMSAPYY
jgi:hypothetical protein